MWGATGATAKTRRRPAISIHAPRVGRDIARKRESDMTINFNPRAPCGARPKTSCRLRACGTFQSTRPVWGATHGTGSPCLQINISIHAPRVGRDYPPSLPLLLCPDFNPRAPCGARHDRCRHADPGGDFNPRAPCGARRCGHTETVQIYGFQSTRPVWGATVRQRQIRIPLAISIHAPRVGRDG